MPISRRTLLSIVPAATLAAVVPPLRAWADTGTLTADVVADQSLLTSNIIAIFAGTAESNARPETAAKLSYVASNARKWLAAMDTTGQGQLFSGIALGTSDSNLSASYLHLYEIALATRVPGGASDLKDNVTVQRRVIDGLVWLYDNYFGDQSKGYYGNWYNWEIGIPASVSKTLVLLKDQIAAYKPDLAATYVAALDGYLRNGKNGDVDLDSRFHTGANLADITTNRIIQGAALGDEARIRKAIADQLTVFATVDPYNLQHGVTDGFYADGSFIQHASVAYTGSYGLGLLSRVVQTITMLNGTSYLQGGDLVGAVQGWVVDSFAPLIFEGYMMEIVKGRAVSRTTSGYTDGATAIQALVDLSAFVASAESAALKAYVNFIRQKSRATVNPTSFVSPVTITRYADILADPSIGAKDINPPERNVPFNAMDRTVHIRPGYAFALARNSKRISKYEYMSGENLMPWFQGEGAHYLYLSGQDQNQSFGVDYFTTVSPYRLAGVTSPVEERRTVPELYGKLWYDNPDRGFISSSESQNTYVYFPCGTNTYSGGARLGSYGAVGLILSDDVAYAAKQAGLLPDDFVVYRNAQATKSWFMLDDEIVVLAAGVGDSARRGVVTTVDTRIAGASDSVALAGQLRDCTAWSGVGSAPLAWLRYANSSQGAAVGYVFLDQQTPKVALDTVTRSRRSIRLPNPDQNVTKQVFSVSIEQAAGAALTSMAYALVPNASEQQLKSYAGGPLSVLVNNERIQAVKHLGLGLVAANAFASGTHDAERLSIDGAASVILREDGDGTTSVAVADPSMDRDTVSVIVRGRAMSVVSADEGVTVSPVAGGTRIDVTTHHAYGRSFTVTLR